jgi:hypothetical protein
MQNKCKVTLGFLTVSSTLKTRQAASVAAFIALICKFMNLLRHHPHKTLELESKTMQMSAKIPLQRQAPKRSWQMNQQFHQWLCRPHRVLPHLQQAGNNKIINF